MANPIKIKALVSEIVPHGEGVYTLKMRPEGRLPRFKPGQFLHLTVDAYDPSGGYWPESRVFSIASCFDEKELEIVYSVKGLYTKKMETLLAPGLEVWLKFPCGDFIIGNCLKAGQTAVLIAGGTGISPFIPFLQGMIKGDLNTPVLLFYGVRNRRNLLFTGIIEECAKSLANFSFYFYIENEKVDSTIQETGHCHEGQLSLDAIFAETAMVSDPVYFLSGPPSMIKSFKAQLVEKNVSIDSIKTDDWE